MVLLIDLIPTWNPHSTAASQDKPTAAEVAAAIEEQKQEAANMARSQLAEQKFQELNAKAQSGGMAPVIVQLRVAFRPEGDLLNAAKVQAQRVLINQTQDSLMKELTGYDPASLKRFEHTPYVAMKVNAAGLEALRQSPNVINIHKDEFLRPALFHSVPLVGAPIMWANGYTGAGKTVAIVDTGVDKTHQFLTGKVVSEACYSTNNTDEHATSLCPGGVTESTAVDSGLHCGVSNDCAHGTHAAGVAAGTDPNFSGVAKGANLISIQVFSRIDDSSECNGSSPCIRALTSDLMKGLERVYSLRDTYSIASVNLSLGGGRFTSNCDTHPLKGIIDQLRSAGIATVIASGNDGYTDAISEPACISSAISVGATTYFGDEVASFSNSASFLNLLAPGDYVTSSVPNRGYTTYHGTSSAAPHVAGAWAILKQRTPSAGVTELLNYLTSRGYPITDSRNGVTLPRLNLGPPPSCIETNIPMTDWKGEYYSNINLSGDPMMVRNDGDGFLDFNFGDGSPSATCDLGADNFSARWTRTVRFATGAYRFTVTGDDGVRLYVDGQLKIDKWLIQAPTTYTADVFLFTGDHEVKLEYFEACCGAVAKLSWEALNSGCYADVPIDHWRGEYYNNINPQIPVPEDIPRIIRDDGDNFLNFDFGDGSPGAACGLGADNFSARWTRWVNFTTGVYRFSVTADDGVRLYVDGLSNQQLIIDKWFNQAPTTYTADLFLPAGQHLIRLEYFEGVGNALAKLSWETLADGNCFADVPSTHWRGEYHSGADLTRNLLMVRDDGDASLNFDIGDGNPGAACSLGADNFSVVWTRTVNFANGVYRFTVTGDDGVRLYIDGKLIIDKWFTQAATTYTADIFLSPGDRNVRLEYFEASGNAVAKLSWQPLADGNCYATVPADHWTGVYYSNTNFEGEPAMIRDDGANFLNFDIGDGSPGGACDPGADNFSVRWMRKVHFTTGRYRFTVTGDDGVRLYVGGLSNRQLIIDKFFNQAPTTYTADLDILGDGDYDVTLEYFEGAGGALARLSWESLSGPDCFPFNIPSDHWQGLYYNNTNLLGEPWMYRDEGDGFLDIDFGNGGPGGNCGLGVDNFSARWSRSVNFAPGTYRFTVTGDDGVRLLIDLQLKIDKWFVQAPTTYTYETNLSGGNHTITLLYFEKTGGAQAHVNWTLISGP